MESVMNFLSEYYIWFFVAAGILVFALIGFILDSKKRKSNEFKGESIEETKQENNPVEVVGNTVNMGGDATLGSPVENAVEAVPIETPTTEPTLEEAPVIEEQPTPPIEFYSGPVEMPSVTPAPIENTNYETEQNVNEPMPIFEETTNNDFVSPIQTVEEPPIRDTISYQEIPSTNTNTEETPENKPVENIFDNLN